MGEKIDKRKTSVHKRGPESKLVPCFDPERGKICLWSRRGGTMCAIGTHPDLKPDCYGCCFVRSKHYRSYQK